jgi:hypothetical protein
LQGYKKNTFFRLCHAIAAIGSLNHGVAWDASHVLDELDLHLNSWIVQHNKCPNKGDVVMGTLECIILLQNLVNKTPHVFY